jgi:5-methylcytosine-specific restriction endonuclease McrA
MLKEKTDRNEKIKKLYESGKSLSGIASLFNVSRQRVHQIVSGYKTSNMDYYKKMMYPDQNGKCIVCNVEFSDEVKSEIHHIDKNPANNKFSNLVLLCQKCHKETHKLYKKNGL